MASRPTFLVLAGPHQSNGVACFRTGRSEPSTARVVVVRVPTGGLLVHKRQQLLVEAFRGFKMGYMADPWNFDEFSSGNELSRFSA
jgi:hypothetical protein